jgi:two-component system, cell cycle sensor histidine kinase and response regulator CckA
VSDTGVGMPPDVIAHAFEPFFTTKGKGEGSGLGLATVYGIAVEAGGNVTLYSSPGIGTTVRVHLPLADRALPQSGRRHPEIQRSGEGQTVLVVEDEDAMRKVTTRILRRNGYRGIEACSGIEALELVRTNPVDLLLSDVVMPQQSGPDLAAEVRNLLPGMPVLFMSGYSQGVLSRRRGLPEDLALIQKPFNESTLVARVHEMLSAPREPG